jgi:hypothetical protein
MDRRGGAQAAGAALGRAARVKFPRHLGAAALAVAVVVALGLAWNHFAPASLVGDIQGPTQEIVPGYNPTAPPDAEQPAVRGQHVRRGELPREHGPHGGSDVRVVRTGSMDLGLDSMFQSVNLPVLRHTVVIEGGVIAAVVIIDVIRRRSRRAARAAQLAASSDGEDEDADL